MLAMAIHLQNMFSKLISLLLVFSQFEFEIILKISKMNIDNFHSDITKFIIK